MPTIALDAMGGDHGVEATVNAAAQISLDREAAVGAILDGLKAKGLDNVPVLRPFQTRPPLVARPTTTRLESKLSTQALSPGSMKRRFHP